MTLRTNVITLFNNQGTAAQLVSDAFELNEKPSNFARPQLRTFGDLDGGVVVLQTLNSDVNLSNADNSYSSTDWQDTADLVPEQDVVSLNITSLKARLKLSNLGASANWSAELVKD